MSEHDHTNDGEIWKAVEGYPLYQVSNSGRFRSCRGGKWKDRKPVVQRDGYLRIMLYRDGIRKIFNAHRLVLEAFVGPCPENMECRHLDGSRSNNWIGNLCWGTASENQRDRRRHGRGSEGSRSHWAKLSEADVIEIRRLRQLGVSRSCVARKFRVSISAVKKIAMRLIWTHI